MLASWNDGPARSAIVDFVERVTEEGGTDFVPPAERIAVLDNDVQVSFERRDGRVVLVRHAAMLGSPNEGPPKPINIQAHIGRHLDRRQQCRRSREARGERPSLCLVVDHDDAEREYAYASSAATDPDAEPILETADRFGWTTVSMRRAWSRIFAE